MNDRVPGFDNSVEPLSREIAGDGHLESTVEPTVTVLPSAGQVVFDSCQQLSTEGRRIDVAEVDEVPDDPRHMDLHSCPEGGQELLGAIVVAASTAMRRRVRSPEAVNLAGSMTNGVVLRRPAEGLGPTGRGAAPRRRVGHAQIAAVGPSP